MSGAQLTTPASRLSALKAAAAWKASCVNLNSTSAGCTPPLMRAFSTKKCDGEFWARTTVFPRKSAIGLDRLAHDDAVAAVRPVDLLVDARHDAGVLAQALEEERHHVERRPADVEVAGRERVAHRHRIVDQDQFDLEVLAAGRLPHLSGLEAVVGVDDRAPPGPDVDGEPHRPVHHRRVAGNPLDFGELGRGDEVVFLDGRDAGAVRLLPRCRPIASARRSRIVRRRRRVPRRRTARSPGR